jgi:hypothetical protein
VELPGALLIEISPFATARRKELEAGLKFPGVDQEEYLLEDMHCAAVEAGLVHVYAS